MKKRGFKKRNYRDRLTGQNNFFNRGVVVVEEARAGDIVNAAFNKWQPTCPTAAAEIFQSLKNNFPDDYQPDDWWDSAAHLDSKQFFVWGHDHNFGHGFFRKGSMGTRHLEITAESLSLGFLPERLDGKKVLDVGVWTGGDLITLAGLGGSCFALEEHPIAAKAAAALVRSLEVPAEIVQSSVFEDKESWSQSFDYIYCSGVVYHVTDPVLFLRILFCYLKIGGELLIETKAIGGRNATCGYSGTMERGWNWFAPNELTLGRWLVDAGFEADNITIHRRKNGRLLSHSVKRKAAKLGETGGFSRPRSWLEKEV